MPVRKRDMILATTIMSVVYIIGAVLLLFSTPLIELKHYFKIR